MTASRVPRATPLTAASGSARNVRPAAKASAWLRVTMGVGSPGGMGTARDADEAGRHRGECRDRHRRRLSPSFRPAARDAGRSHREWSGGECRRTRR